MTTSAANRAEAAEAGSAAPLAGAGFGTGLGARSGARLGPLLPARLRSLKRPNLVLELVFTVALYLAYSRTRRYVPRHKTAALHRAREVLHAERLMHVDIELTINHAVDRVNWLVVGMNYYYATLHFIVTPCVLVWVYARRPDHYRSVRTALYSATLLALIGFTFFALAPPRFLTDQGFIDTIVTHHTWGSWGSGQVSGVSNQYAAMPSVHIVWSAWSGLTVAFLARHTWVRVLGVCYPLATFTVILGTANHFLADAVAGAATLALGFLIQRLLIGRPAYRQVAAASVPSARKDGGDRAEGERRSARKDGEDRPAGTGKGGPEGPGRAEVPKAAGAQAQDAPDAQDGARRGTGAGEDRAAPGRTAGRA
jgi:hypothetical protein